MKTKQHHYLNDKWIDYPSELNTERCQLVLVFGASAFIVNQNIFLEIKKQYPNADIVLSSTAGEILNDQLFEDSVIATAIEFEKSESKCVKTNIAGHKNSFEVGSFLMKQLRQANLKGVFVVSDGTMINGSELVEGFNHQNHENISVTGGLAGDGERFTDTQTGLNEIPTQGNVIAIGFYGDDISIGHGSFGGWDEFGHERIVTRADQNILYEIDEKNALDLYKQYLGGYAKDLPGSALLFPLSIKLNGSDKPVIRTVLTVDNDKKIMTFAGNLPVGSKARLMKANFNKLINAASVAATNSLKDIYKNEPDLAILTSCIGRKLILQERTEEELEAAKEILGRKTAIAGFYSYGEISPFEKDTPCELHNQTMTITTFSER